MTTLDSRCLEAFPGWLRALADDARALAARLEDTEAPPAARAASAQALNYLFKSLDLIPDGLEELGFIDDAFVLRVAAKLALEDDPRAGAGDESGTLARLREDAALIAEFLGADYERLERHVRGLADLVARGRRAADVLEAPTATAEFLRELTQWSNGYAAPNLAHDPRTLIKLRAFFAQRLAAAS